MALSPTSVARRDPARLWPGVARRALRSLGQCLPGQCLPGHCLLGLCLLGLRLLVLRLLVLCLAVTGAGRAVASDTSGIQSATFLAPTTRYAHAVLGDGVEYGALRIRLTGEAAPRDVTLPQDHVFEDLAPRLVDLTLDGRADAVMVVETDMARGAALALYGPEGKLAETPHIGRTNRWLAPVGAADLDGDGRVEIAYVDRPHLARTLRIWRYQDGALTQIAAAEGLANHRIGEDFISGGIRTCAGRPEIVTADARWQRVMITRLTADGLKVEAEAPFTGPAALLNALSCR
ncbi:MAG: VCBS repeat-containing protein [Pseudomonadota bacterium]